MKRVLIVIALLILIWFGYTVITNGFTNEALNIDISSHKTIEKKSNELTKSLASYNKKNDEEYETAKNSLSASIKSYETAKEEYEKVLEEIGIAEENQETNQEILTLSTKVYEIDFLLTTLGTYANRESVDVTLNLTKSTNSGGYAGTGYTLCNLQFIVSGEYIRIANFVSDLESDDELAFEIRNYTMLPTNDTVSAEFVVYNIPINSATLIDSVVSSGYLDGGSSTSTSSSYSSTDTGNTN